MKISESGAIQLAPALIFMLLTASPVKGQLRELLHDIQKGLQKDVDKELSSSVGERMRKAAADLVSGATVSNAIGKQIELAMAAAAIQMTLVPALDARLTLASRNTLKGEFTAILTLLATRYGARGMQEYCKQKERDCACLTGSALSQKIGDDLYKEVTKPGFASMLIRAEIGSKRSLLS